MNTQAHKNGKLIYKRNSHITS